MQMADNNNSREDKDLQAPAKLVSALSRLSRQRIFVPRAIDETVLREARHRLEKPGHSRARWLRLLPRLAAVAIVVLLLTYVFLRERSNFHSPTFAREDVNHDGRVDILDAFALARQLQSGQARGAGLDVNGDGIVDERDVQTIAGRAVRLVKGGHS